MGSLIIGLLTGNKGMERVHGFFIIPFQGILWFFYYIIINCKRKLKNIITEAVAEDMV